MTIHSISDDIRGTIDKGYRLKVSVLDLGIYMDGFRAIRSERNAGDWWIQAPAIFAGHKWRGTPEFDKTTTLWEEIEQACLETIQEAERGGNNNNAEETDSPRSLFPRTQGFGIRPQPRGYHE